jgi:hypothetical protein
MELSSSPLDKFGGRKFLMGMLMLAVGGVIESLNPNGISANMVALIGAVYATFSASNAFVTGRQLNAPVAEAAAPEAPTPQPIDLSPLAANQEQIGQAIGALMQQQAQSMEMQSKQTESLQTILKGINVIIRTQNPS